MKVKLNRNLQIGYGFSIIMLMFLGLFSYYILHSLWVSNQSVTRSDQVMLQLENTISIIKEAENGQLGYLLTGEEEFLSPYTETYQKALKSIQQVEKLTGDNPRQQTNIRKVKQILADRLVILKKLIDKRKLKQAITPTDMREGKLAMDTLRATVDKAEQEERLLFVQYTKVVNRYLALAPFVIFTAIVIVALLSVFSYLKLTSDVREKDRLSRELEETDLFRAQEELEDKVIALTQALTESEEKNKQLNEELKAINKELATSKKELGVSRGYLDQSSQLFRSIVGNMPNSLVIVIGQDHRFLSIEGELAPKAGYSPDYVGKHWAEISAFQDYSISAEQYERLMAGEHFSDERKNAEGVTLRIDFMPLRNDNREVYAGLIIALDITDLKQAEEKSLKLAAIVESSDDAIISKTLDGIITSWNRSAERMFGYTEREMIGTSILTLIPEDRQQEEPAIIARLKRGERVQHFETKRITKEKVYLDVSLTISPLRDKLGNVIGVSKIVRDISERKKNEQRKNDFIGMVSHELKTPLTSLTAIVQVTKAKLKNSPDTFLSEAMEKANTQVKRMSGMINGFLNVSRLESGQMHIITQEFELRELIEEIVGEYQLTVSAHQIEISICDLVKINADREKIGSVLSNLISNAVKYSPKGKHIEIQCKISQTYVQVSVKDEGMGIKAKDVPHVFDRYFRIETAHTQHISGFGIGLYLSAEIIRQHHGEIWLESESGVGSTFYFSLPVV